MDVFSTRPLLLVFLVMVSGCVAETVEKKRPRKGPVPEVGYVDTGGGEVRYSEDGWGLVVAGRRREALRKMRRVCRGLNARITDEFTHQDVDVAYSNDDLAPNMEKGLDHYNVSAYHHIVFECQVPEKPLPKPAAKSP